MLFSLFQGASRENVVKAQGQPIWPILGYNAQHTGQCPYDTSKNNGTLKWKFGKQSSAGIPESNFQSSPVISSDGTIYVAGMETATPSYLYLYAVNPNGTLKWKFETGDRILRPPAISSDGIIYIVPEGVDGRLYAIGATTVITLQIGKASFTVNGIPRTLDSPPVIKNSRTLLPIRAIIEALGGTVG
jgi:outer membrane protein assembly factor BamB